MQKVAFNINGTTIEYSVDGDTVYGSDQVLLEGDDNLISGTDWAERGYTIQPFLSPSENEVIRSGLESTLIETMRRFTSVDESKFTLEKYHEFVDNDLHRQITGELRGGFRVEHFPGGIFRVEKRVSKICGVELTSTCPSVGWGGYFIRIVRPNLKTDNNPPHRDVWLETLRSCVNIYFPLAGSDERSALPIVPGSHLWRESDIERTATGAKVDAATYQVPSVTSWKKSMALERPNPQKDEVMVFTPYAIHGGGINLSPDSTRMSLEARFWRRPE